MITPQEMKPIFKEAERIKAQIWSIHYDEVSDRYIVLGYLDNWVTWVYTRNGGFIWGHYTPDYEKALHEYFNRMQVAYSR